MYNEELIEELSPKQKVAFLKMQKYLQKGFSITESADRARVNVSDFNNARASLKRLEKFSDKIRPVGSTIQATNLKAYPFDPETRERFKEIICAMTESFCELDEFINRNL